MRRNPPGPQLWIKNSKCFLRITEELSYTKMRTPSPGDSNLQEDIQRDQHMTRNLWGLFRIRTGARYGN
jgi:hypothetical protein